MKYDWLEDPIKYADRNENPTVLVKMKSGYAVIGATQFLPGYCLLLGTPTVNQLTDLPIQERSDFLSDMSILGEAIQYVCNPLRINYSIYGNFDSYLHAHVFPRYEWEPESHKKMPVWKYPESYWSDSEYEWDKEKHKDLMEKLSKELKRLMKKYYFDKT